MVVKINMDKARDMGHTRRRIARNKEFEPYDAIIMKQIPGNDFAQAEAARQAIRDKYAEIQTQIDAATTTDEIRAALNL